MLPEASAKSANCAATLGNRKLKQVVADLTLNKDIRRKCCQQSPKLAQKRRLAQEKPTSWASDGVHADWVGPGDVLVRWHTDGSVVHTLKLDIQALGC